MPSSQPPRRPSRLPPRPKRRFKRLNPLPLSIRVTLLVLGWLLLLLGILGLFLPGLQGALTLMLGAALLSLASDWAYKRLRALLHRWPNLWTKVQEFRHWAHAKLSPHNGDPAETEGEVDERGDDRG